MLIPITRVLANLLYHQWGYPGAMRHAYAQPDVDTALTGVNTRILDETKGRGRLLVWDAYRTLQCQKHIYDKCRAEIISQNPALTADEADRAVSHFVSPASQLHPAPHNTGGAVDVTIMYDNQSQALGRFDDFSPHGRTDYYDHQPPERDEDVLARDLRALLKRVMTEFDFVGIESEWWHFELGTKRWAENKDKETRFNRLLSPPSDQSLGTWHPSVPIRQPLHLAGVAQVFTSAEDRTASLSGDIEGYYYARRRHPTERQLADVQTKQFYCDHAVYVQSGLAASVIAVLAHVPYGGSIAFDHQSYYETAESVERLANHQNWQVHWVEMSKSCLAGIPKVDAIVTESPRNWLLTCPDLDAISCYARSNNAVLIVDSSLQPLRTLRGIADVVVVSLSKYPSAGLTLGGAIGYYDMEMYRRCIEVASLYGAVLSPEAAMTILTQTHTLPDRLSALSTKTCNIAEFLRKHPAVGSVLVPVPEQCGGLSGGQLTFRAISREVAAHAERVVTNNALNPDFCLSLACTFGAMMTTFEHFGSRASANLAGARRVHISDDMIRIGVGTEPEEKIITCLDEVLRLALQTR